MAWPNNKLEREDKEIKYFIKYFKNHYPMFDFKIKYRTEKPDYILIDSLSDKEIGVELTSVYLDDKSVPRDHKKNEGAYIADDNNVEIYAQRIIESIKTKIIKANKEYKTTIPLMLSIYLNEYQSIHLEPKEFEKLLRDEIKCIKPFEKILLHGFCDDESVLFCL